MDVNNLNNWISRPNVCRCCLSASGVWDLSASYISESGSKEIYSDMLRTCYGISMSHISSCSPSRLLCSKCLGRLRDAFSFHSQVLSSERLFADYCTTREFDTEPEEKLEPPSPAGSNEESDEDTSIEEPCEQIECTETKEEESTEKQSQEENHYDSDEPIASLINKAIEAYESTSSHAPNKDYCSSSHARNKDYCFYCETFVLNFARHLRRHHICNSDVQKILSKPKKSLERKQLIAALRKKGNYLVNSKEVVKPMRKLSSTDYLPCTSCLGFYSKKLLWKHKQKCTGKPASAVRQNVQSEAQNMLIRHLKIDEKLKETVFPRMRADKTSLIAKKDYLICAFGSQYLKTHRERHSVNVVSRKMRELAKLVIELKKIDPSIHDLFGALQPSHYDSIVEATKVLGKYDREKDRFEAPTFALNMSTTLKQCCNIAIMIAFGPDMDVDTGKIEADLRTTMQLIESNWKYDVYSQAATDLIKKKFNKITIVPLANDLKILKDYLNKKTLEAAVKIKEGLQSISIYTELLETVYCRVLLLNRRRPEELQRLTLHNYLESVNNATDKCEEYVRTLTVSERILVKKFKIVIVRVKRDLGVPVLFDPVVQDDIKLLLSIRNKCSSSTTNRFLFGNPGFINPINGYKVLERYARLSGVKNPQAVYGTRLRKHVAILSQILSMSENDMDQLATLMGHTREVHKKSYRQPDDIYQMAKIAKLLILMEEGKADAYTGKSLEEIDLDLNEELHEGDPDDNQIMEDDCVPVVVVNDDQICNQSVLSKAVPSSFRSTESTIKKGSKRTLVPWTMDQKDAVTKYFKVHIKNRQPPKRHECEKLKAKHGDLLENKDWLKIKVFVQNTYSKIK